MRLYEVFLSEVLQLLYLEFLLLNEFLHCHALKCLSVKRESFVQILAIVSLRTKLELPKIFEQYYISKIGKASFFCCNKEKKIMVINSLNED